MTEFLRIEEIIDILKVSKSFVKTQFQTADLGWETSPVGGLNRKVHICDKEKLMSHIAETIKVYYYDRSLKDFNRKKRPELTEITVPDKLKKEIQSGNFEFRNTEDIMEMFQYSSRESVYQLIYEQGFFILKLGGKTYFWLENLW